MNNMATFASPLLSNSGDEWVRFLLRIREVSVSILVQDGGYPGCGTSWFFSVHWH